MAGGTVIYTKQTLESEYQKAEDLARNLLLKSKPNATVVIRDLNPEDLGATDYKYVQNLATAGAYNEVYSTQLPDGKVVVIFGVEVPPTTTSTMIKFRASSETKNIVEIEKAKVSDDNLLIMNEPVAYEPNAILKIEQYVPNNTTVPATDNVIYLGVVAETKQISEITPSKELEL